MVDPKNISVYYIPIDIIGQLYSSGYYMTRRMSIWFALVLAVFGTVTIKFPMSKAIMNPDSNPNETGTDGFERTAVQN
uniref:Neur_chan_memb domain-containing protein n=1 Tax=Caenorhabditis tropicalis TaxID=1561998 RepID=A0A1I7U9P4_9PELO